jgi:putative PIN family toxin of toxin-antitoxin system
LRVFENHTLYISEEILVEYKAVISRPKFKYVKKRLYSLIEIICETSEFVVITKSKFSLPDKKDLIYLDTALSSNAQYFITGNKKDFPEKNYKNSTIISPADFLSIG